MPTAVAVRLRAIGLICRGHRAVALENLALRQQLTGLTRRVTRPNLRRRDRRCWVVLAKVWPEWRTALMVVRPDTVVTRASSMAPPPLDAALNANASRPPEPGCGYADARGRDGRGEPTVGSPSDPW